MIAHSYYEEDPRVRREAEALVARGRPVDVYRPAPARTTRRTVSSTVSGSTGSTSSVTRAPGSWAYLREYLGFLVRAGGRRDRATIGAGAIASSRSTGCPTSSSSPALPLRMAGVTVILDLHEAMPEFFPTRFPRAASPRRRGACSVQERLSIAFADRVFSVNELMADRLLALGVRPPS